MEKDDKGSTMIRMGVSGWMFLLVPAYPGCPGSKAVKRSLLLLMSSPVFFNRGRTTAFLNSVGKQPVASDRLNKAAIGGDSSVRMSLTSHVGAGSSWHDLFGDYNYITTTITLFTFKYRLDSSQYCILACHVKDEMNAARHGRRLDNRELEDFVGAKFHMWPIDWHQHQWRWMTLKVIRLLQAFSSGIFHRQDLSWQHARAVRLHQLSLLRSSPSALQYCLWYNFWQCDIKFDVIF